jgi:hypothetical protein
LEECLLLAVFNLQKWPNFLAAASLYSMDQLSQKHFGRFFSQSHLVTLNVIYHNDASSNRVIIKF